MAKKTRAQLVAEAEQIRDEVVNFANTANRVGGHMLNKVDSSPVVSSDSGVPTTTPERLDLYIDTDNENVYIGVDNVDATDWDRLAKYSDLTSISGYVRDSDFDANTILAADTDDTPSALTIGEQTIVGRITGGNIDALTATEVRTLINVENGADVTDAENIEDAITGTGADTLTDASIIPFVKAATLVKITWANIKATLKTYFDTLYANKNQTTAEDLTLTGTENLDLSTFDSFEGLLTGNTTITVTNTPASGVTFTRNLIISGSAGTETLTLPVSWNIYGEYVVDEINYLTIEFANFATNGLQVNCFINQPT